MGPYKGRNVFFVNEKPMPPLMYSSTEQGRKTWADPTRQCIIDFTAQGYEILPLHEGAGAPARGRERTRVLMAERTDAMATIVLDEDDLGHGLATLLLSR